MAISLDASGPNELAIGSSPISDDPVTMAGRIYIPTSVTGIFATYSINKGSGFSDHLSGLIFNGAVWSQAKGTGGDSTATKGTMSADTWHHLGHTFGSSTSRRAWLDGVAGTEDTTSINVTSLNQMDFGHVATFQDATYYAAEWGVWNVVLNATEMGMLALGLSPLMVRPDALVCYSPFIKHTALNDIVGGQTWGYTTIPATAAHPSIIMPSSPRIIHVPAAAGGSTEGAGSSTGTSTVSGVGEGFSLGVGGVTGTSTVVATGRATASAEGAATGISTVVAVDQETTTGGAWLSPSQIRNLKKLAARRDKKQRESRRERLDNQAIARAELEEIYNNINGVTPEPIRAAVAEFVVKSEPDVDSPINEPIPAYKIDWEGLARNMDAVAILAEQLIEADRRNSENETAALLILMAV